MLLMMERVELHEIEPWIERHWQRKYARDLQQVAQWLRPLLMSLSDLHTLMRRLSLFLRALQDARGSTSSSTSPPHGGNITIIKPSSSSTGHGDSEDIDDEASFQAYIDCKPSVDRMLQHISIMARAIPSSMVLDADAVTDFINQYPRLLSELRGTIEPLLYLTLPFVAVPLPLVNKPMRLYTIAVPATPQPASVLPPSLEEINNDAAYNYYSSLMATLKKILSSEPFGVQLSRLRNEVILHEPLLQRIAEARRVMYPMLLEPIHQSNPSMNQSIQCS